VYGTETEAREIPMTAKIEILNEGTFTAKIDGIQLQDKNGWKRRFKSEKACRKAAEKVAKGLDADWPGFK
jgi:hypothetical protein